ncbi:MAG: site-2 protease family protein [Actinomycetota bacterium]|nr:site-2 protease family protein [Actinomycetota bacterium]
MRGLQFTVAGVPTRIEPLFFVVMGLFGLAGGRRGWLILEWLVVAGVSILVHEMGHAAAFRRFGARPEIVLHGFGGATTGAAQPPLRSIVVSIAGPVTGFAVGIAALAVARAVTPTDSELLEAVLVDLIFVNIAWGVFNLLPILPLDGGNIVAGFFEQTTGDTTQRKARIVSVATAAVVGLVGLAYGQPYVALLAALFGSQNFRSLGADRDQPAYLRLSQARDDLAQGRFQEAAGAAAEVAAGRPSPRVQTLALELQAWAHLAAGEPEQAENALAPLGGGVSASQLVRSMVELANGRPAPALPLGFASSEDLLAVAVAARLVADARRLDQLRTDLGALSADQAIAGLRALQLGLHHGGRYADSALTGALLFEHVADPLVAYNTACSWAVAGADEEALAWLSKAVDKGFRNTELLDGDSNFDTLRTTDGFQALRSWIETGPSEEDTTRDTGAP